MLCNSVNQNQNKGEILPYSVSVLMRPDDVYRADIHRAGRQGLLLRDRKPHKCLPLQSGGILGAATGGQRTLSGGAASKGCLPWLGRMSDELWVRAADVPNCRRVPDKPFQVPCAIRSL